MRRKHEEKECSEPWVKWKRMRFPKVPEEWEEELRAEADSDRDLKKSIPQLISDFNVKANEAGKLKYNPDTNLMLDAQRRMVAMMGKVAMSNDRMALAMIGLTTILIVLTIILVFKG